MATATGQVLTVTDDTFNQLVIEAKTPVLVEFGAWWCPPCRAAAPILAQLSDELAGRLVVATIDTDAEPQVAAGLGVMGLPTFVLYKDGVPVEQVVGFQPKPKLLEKIRPHLNA
jgi:thioredoxin 1